MKNDKNWSNLTIVQPLGGVGGLFHLNLPTETEFYKTIDTNHDCRGWCHLAQELIGLTGHD